MKKLGVVFVIVFVSAFGAAIFAKTLKTPEFAYIERPIVDNLLPWQMYTNNELGITLSYPAYLSHQSDEQTSAYEASLAYELPDVPSDDYPAIDIRSDESSLSLADWFEETHADTVRCSPDASACFGVTSPTPIVLHGETALQFERNEETYHDTYTVFNRKDRILIVTNHSTRHGSIPEATYNRILEHLVFLD